jgi:predicted kinase
MAGTRGWKPLLVLVSGAPGSGKTTLARLIAAELDVLHLNRDDILHGVRFSMQHGAPDTLKVVRGVPLWWGAIEHLLAGGVSMVADGTMYRGEFEGDVRRLVNFADVVNVHCRCTSWLDRFRSREIEKQGEAPDSERLRFLMAKIENNKHKIVEPLQTDATVIEVQTDDGYQPTIDDIVGRLLERSPVSVDEPSYPS